MEDNATKNFQQMTGMKDLSKMSAEVIRMFWIGLGNAEAQMKERIFQQTSITDDMLTEIRKLKRLRRNADELFKFLNSL